MANNLINLKIVSREGVIFSGNVNFLTSYNNKGKFDILPYHANIISLITNKILYNDSEGNSHKIDIDSALLRKQNAEVEIYLGVRSFSGQKNDQLSQDHVK